jgi:hypothetical protein
MLEVRLVRVLAHGALLLDRQIRQLRLEQAVGLDDDLARTRRANDELGAIVAPGLRQAHGARG